MCRSASEAVCAYGEKEEGKWEGERGRWAWNLAGWPELPPCLDCSHERFSVIPRLISKHLKSGRREKERISPIPTSHQSVSLSEPLSPRRTHLQPHANRKFIHTPKCLVKPTRSPLWAPRTPLATRAAGSTPWPSTAPRSSTSAASAPHAFP